MKKRFPIYFTLICSAILVFSSCAEDLKKDKDLLEIESILINNKVVENNASITINTSSFILETSGANSSYSQLMVICTSASGIDTLFNSIDDNYYSYDYTNSDSINIPTKTGQYKIIFKELSYGTKKTFNINVTANITDALLTKTTDNYLESEDETKTSGTNTLLTKIGLSWSGTAYTSTTYRLTVNSGVKVVSITETEYENASLQSEIETLINNGTQESSISLSFDSYNYNKYLTDKYYAIKNGDYYAVVNFTKTYYYSYYYYSPDYKIYFDIKQ